jgi:hypothetical protein
MGQEKKPIGLMTKVKIMRMYRGMYARICDPCKKDLVTLTMQHSRGGNVDIKAVVGKAKQITCNKCKNMITKYMQNIMEALKNG